VDGEGVAIYAIADLTNIKKPLFHRPLGDELAIVALHRVVEIITGRR
jgi:hypothetical protein